MNKAILDVVDAIVKSKEYQECIDIKKRMEENDDITMRIKRIKILQKKYLRTNDIEVEKELQKLEEELYEIPIYYEYNKKLEIVNQKIQYVTDEINDYFSKLFQNNNS